MTTDQTSTNSQQYEDFVEQVRAMLRPLLQAKTEAPSVAHLIDTLQPARSDTPADLDTLLLFQLATAQGPAETVPLDTHALLARARDRINSLCTKAQAFELSLRQAMGQNLYAQIPDGAELQNLGKAMYENEPWSFAIGEELVEVPEDMEELL